MRRVIALALFVVLLAAPAAAERRLALVIGNDAYSEVAPLHKAVNDAQAMADTFAALGFEVILARDASRREMNFRVQEFVNRIGAGDVAAVFYAGHGVEIAGENFLLPVDIPGAEPGQEGYVKAEAVSLNAVLDMLRARKARLNIVLLDACRNNPFARGGSRAVGGQRGLARINAPEGTFVMYSADAGEAALDRLTDADTDPNSVFTRTLIPLMQEPGRDLVDMAREVRRRVRALAQSVAHQQTPAYYDAVLGTFSFVDRPAAPAQTAASGQAAATQGPAPQAAAQAQGSTTQQAPAQQAPAQHVPAQEAPAQQAPVQQAPVQQAPAQQTPATVPAETVRNDFDLARTIDTADAWRAFLARHGHATNSFYVQLARAALAKQERPAPEKDQSASGAADAGTSERAAFEQARRTDTVAGWEDFIDRYEDDADSLYVDLAYAALDRLEGAAPMPTPGQQALTPDMQEQLARLRQIFGGARGAFPGAFPDAFPGAEPDMPAPDRLAALTDYELQDFGVPAQRSLHAGAPHGPTPTEIPGGRVITTAELVGLAGGGQRFLLLDVLGGAQRLPNAVRAVPAAQAGSFDDAVQDDFDDYLWRATGGDFEMPIVLYCAGVQCWMSYNAALRAINLGYEDVRWYRGGIEAWQGAGGALASW